MILMVFWFLYECYFGSSCACEWFFSIVMLFWFLYECYMNGLFTGFGGSCFQFIFFVFAQK